MKRTGHTLVLLAAVGASVVAATCREACAQIAIRAKTVYTMVGAPGDSANVIKDGVIVITDGKVAAVGPAASIAVPDGHFVYECAVATPGLIDPRSTVGVSGMLNQRQDQDQLETSGAIQPELRAIDAYNPNDPLVSWVRSFGVTTVHTGHAPGELISGQTCIVKTAGRTLEEAVVVETSMVAATLGPGAQRGEGKSPGTRGKMMSMLREELIRAQEYAAKREAGEAPPPDSTAGSEAGAKSQSGRDLRKEMMASVLAGKVPLLLTANRAQDISLALNLMREFKIRLVLDSASESHVLLEEIKAAGVPVILHASMCRAYGDMENMSMETASRLRKAGIPVAIQSGYESYVPKTRVVLLEAAIAASNGLTFEEALATITRDAAAILGLADRVGSLKAGLDGDVAMYDGDPFEYTSHCTGTVINGKITFQGVR